MIVNGWQKATPSPEKGKDAANKKRMRVPCRTTAKYTRRTWVESPPATRRSPAVARQGMSESELTSRSPPFASDRARRKVRVAARHDEGRAHRNASRGAEADRHPTTARTLSSSNEWGGLSRRSSTASGDIAPERTCIAHHPSIRTSTEPAGRSGRHRGPTLPRQPQNCQSVRATRERSRSAAGLALQYRTDERSGRPWLSRRRGRG